MDNTNLGGLQSLKNLNISIIGLGLIGGSLARALHERVGISNIAAFDPDLKALEQAMKDGHIYYGDTIVDEYLADSDIIFICTPVKYTKQYLEILQVMVKKECIITDVGSTKGDIMDFVNTLPSLHNFIGGHPMAGSEKTGYESSSAHLFENAYYILSPHKNTPKKSIEVLKELIKIIGGIPLVLGAQEHDLIAGSISHVPHVIASALVNMVRKIDSSSGIMQTLAAGGFRDITRIASSSPEMWESIVLSNASKIIEILNIYIETLDNIKGSISDRDSKAIYSFFENARSYRDSLPINKRGLIEPSFEIVVDVIDKPGIIGEIASILGRNGVNIKNINVSNSREFEQGCLRITFPNARSIDEGFDLLVKNGYKVFRNGL